MSTMYDVISCFCRDLLAIILGMVQKVSPWLPEGKIKIINGHLEISCICRISKSFQSNVVGLGGTIKGLPWDLWDEQEKYDFNLALPLWLSPGAAGGLLTRSRNINNTAY